MTGNCRYRRPVQLRLIAAALRRMSTELLQEERDAGTLALIAEVLEPREFCRPSSWLTLAARNEPANAVQIQAWQRRE